MAFKKFTIIWSPSFKKEFQKIYEYIAYNLNEPIIARRFYNEIIGSLNSLKLFPKRHPKILSSNKFPNDIRKFIIKKYIIFFSIDLFNNEIHLLHIVHNTQDFFNLL